MQLWRSWPALACLADKLVGWLGSKIPQGDILTHNSNSIRLWVKSAQLVAMSHPIQRMGLCNFENVLSYKGALFPGDLARPKWPGTRSNNWRGITPAIVMELACNTGHILACQRGNGHVVIVDFVTAQARHLARMPQHEF